MLSLLNRIFRPKEPGDTPPSTEPMVNWDDLETEDVYVERIARRIATSVGRLKSNGAFSVNPVPYLEKYVVGHQDDLLDTIYSAGLARRLALSETLRDQYGNLAHVQTLLLGYIDIGVHVNNLCISTWHGTGSNQSRLSAITQIHARALLIADEIFCLLVNGFPSGAQALCRTLYELSIIAKTLANSPGVISRRYQRTHVVEIWNAVKDERALRLDFIEPKSDSAWRDAEKAFNRVVRQYGKEMRETYGWAAPLFATRDNARKRQVKFSDLDSRFGDAERRWRYQNASHFVHGAHLGTVKSVGFDGRGSLTVGPRPVGFAEPATDCLWDLHEIEEVLLRVAQRTAQSAEPLYWLEVQTLAVASMHLFVNDSAGIETLDEFHNQRSF